MQSADYETLFRREAIRQLGRPMPGRPVCRVPACWDWIVLLLVAICAAAVILAITVQYRETETAKGWLVPERGVAQAVHDRYATVRRVDVSQGEHVVAGQVLAVLSADAALPGGGFRSARDSDYYRDEIKAVDSRQSLLVRRYEAADKDLGAQLQHVDLEIASVERQLSGEEERTAMADERLRRLGQAAQAVTEWDLLRLREELAAMHVQQEKLRQQRIVLQRTRGRLRREREAAPLNRDMELSVLRSRRSELAQRLAEAEVNHLATLISPADGIVADIAVQAGETVRPGRVLITVLPSNSPLQAEMYVPSSAAGFVRRGQPVELAFDAFPRHKYGTGTGQILSIAEFVTPPADMPAALASREAAYRVVVGVPTTELELRPGMTLQADLVLERRSVADWLLESLLPRRG